MFRVGDRVYHTNRKEFCTVVHEELISASELCILVRPIVNNDRGWEFHAYVKLLVLRPYTKLEKAMK